MKFFKFKNLVGLALTLCLTLAVMIPTALAAALPLNTGTYYWSIDSTPTSYKREWNGKSAGNLWTLTGGSYTWALTVNGSVPTSLRADLRKVVVLGFDPTIMSNNYPISRAVTFLADADNNSYYAVISINQTSGASGTTSVY